MSFQRGWVYQPAQERPGTTGFVVVTNNRWNQTMLQIGIVPLRTNVDVFDDAYAIALSDGESIIASRLVASEEQSETPLLGPVRGALDPVMLAALEERMCEFFQLPALSTPVPRIPPPLGDATTYPVWSEVYLAGPPIDGERKRRIVVSPNAWNRASGLVTLVRTTTAFKRYGEEFPKIQGGDARACCGDVTTFEHGSVLLTRRSRPDPFTTTTHDMKAIAHGIAAAYELEGTLTRLTTP